MSPRHSDAQPGWIKREFREIRKLIRESNAARRLEAATIGKGGITIKGGGFLRAKYPPELGGGDAVEIGPVPGGPVEGAFDASVGAGFFLALKDEDGNYVFAALRHSVSDDYPTGTSSVTADTELVYLVTGNGVFQQDTGGFALTHTGGITLNGSSGVFVAHSTTGASANCFLDPSDSRIWRSTSSRRYKRDIEDAEVDPTAVLAMQPRTWRDKGEVEKDADTDRRYVGFIAEELHDLGLSQFVVYDAEGDPEAIAYDRLSVALLAVLKDQDARLTALEQSAQSEDNG